MSDKITQQELASLFGDRIPIEAVMLLNSETDIDSLRKQLVDMADESIANQFRKRLAVIVQPGADWYDRCLPELDSFTPNEVIDLADKLDRIISYLESGAGY